MHNKILLSKLGKVTFIAGFFSYVALRITHVFYASSQVFTGNSWNLFLQFKGISEINIISYALVSFSIFILIYSLLTINKD